MISPKTSTVQTQNTAKFDKKLDRITNHLILTATKNKDYKQALRAIEIRFKLDQQKQQNNHIPNAPKKQGGPSDFVQKRLNELEAIGIANGWINDP